MLTEGARLNTGRRHARLGRFCHPISEARPHPEKAEVAALAKGAVTFINISRSFFVSVTFECRQSSGQSQHMPLVVVLFSKECRTWVEQV